jgi:hypothetical protein
LRPRRGKFIIETKLLNVNLQSEREGPDWPSETPSEPVGPPTREAIHD